jgi:hypothetical protein
MLGNDEDVVDVGAHLQEDVLEEEPRVNLVVQRGELIDDDALNLRHVDTDECGEVAGFEDIEAALKFENGGGTHLPIRRLM